MSAFASPDVPAGLEMLLLLLLVLLLLLLVLVPQTPPAPQTPPMLADKTTQPSPHVKID